MTRNEVAETIGRPGTGGIRRVGSTDQAHRQLSA